MEAAARSQHPHLVTQAQALRTESQALRTLSVTARAHSQLVRQRSRVIRAVHQVPPAAQRASVQAAFGRCQAVLHAALPRGDEPPSPARQDLRRRQRELAAPLAELSHALWCWAVCGIRAAPLMGSAEDQARRAWLEELLAAYAAVERQLHRLMRGPQPPPSVAELQQWVARLSLRVDGASPESPRLRAGA
jgi:predicted secreted protein